jgi:hypothetical protein
MDHYTMQCNIYRFISCGCIWRIILWDSVCVTCPYNTSGWHMWRGGGSLLGRSPSVTWHVKPMCQLTIISHYIYIYNRFIYPTVSM